MRGRGTPSGPALGYSRAAARAVLPETVLTAAAVLGSATGAYFLYRKATDPTAESVDRWAAGIGLAAGGTLALAGVLGLLLED